MIQIPNYRKRKFLMDNAMPHQNQKVRQCNDIVYTEDRIPVRKLYVSASTEHVSRTTFYMASFDLISIVLLMKHKLHKICCF